MLEKKISIVTGGGSGIGEAICRYFAELGSQVALLDVNAEQGQKVARDITSKNNENGACEFFLCDVSDADSVVECIKKVLSHYNNRIDILVNNAGVSHIGNIEKVEESDFDRLYQINVKGCYLCSKAVVSQMVKQNSGVILNLASIAATSGLPDRFAYSMSKGAILSMTLSLATDYIKQGIRCNCISPARVHTPFVDGFLQKHYPNKEKEMLEKLAKLQPIGRMARPDEVAKVAAFLCSDDSAFLTGCDYPVDGGFLNVRL